MVWDGFAGNVWKRASRMLSKGLRMVRESLVEGAKVAHMFKEDFDEGMSTIMRQNRGVKQDNPQQQGDGAQSSSFFDSQVDQYYFLVDSLKKWNSNRLTFVFET